MEFEKGLIETNDSFKFIWILFVLSWRIYLIGSGAQRGDNANH